jgi:hypothetical protein
MTKLTSAQTASTSYHTLFFFFLSFFFIFPLRGKVLAAIFYFYFYCEKAFFAIDY